MYLLLLYVYLFSAMMQQKGCPKNSQIWWSIFRASCRMPKIRVSGLYGILFIKIGGYYFVYPGCMEPVFFTGLIFT